MRKTNKDFCKIEDYGFEHIEKILMMISGKWKIQIIYHLGRNENLRYGELKRNLADISHKTLSQQLKDLEQDDFVARKEYPSIPPKVEYRLTEFGKTLLPLYEAFGTWYEENEQILLKKSELV